MSDSLYIIIVSLFIAAIIIIFLYFFVRAICYFFEIKKFQRINNIKFTNTTYNQLYKHIYHIEYINSMVIKENLQIAYQEYQHQNSLLQSKISFFFTLQAIFGGLFTFMYKEVCIYNNIFSFMPILFGFATLLLFSNLENTNNKIANIQFYIIRMEQLLNQPLMNFFENGFYKQNYDSDKNILVLFIPFIIIAWILLGVYLLFYQEKNIVFIFIFFIIIIFMIIINWQYKAQKSYGFDDDKQKK